MIFSLSFSPVEEGRKERGDQKKESGKKRKKATFPKEICENYKNLIYFPIK